MLHLKGRLKGPVRKPKQQVALGVGEFRLSELRLVIPDSMWSTPRSSSREWESFLSLTSTIWHSELLTAAEHTHTHKPRHPAAPSPPNTLTSTHTHSWLNKKTWTPQT